MKKSETAGTNITKKLDFPAKRKILGIINVEGAAEKFYLENGEYPDWYDAFGRSGKHLSTGRV